MKNSLNLLAAIALSLLGAALCSCQSGYETDIAVNGSNWTPDVIPQAGLSSGVNFKPVEIKADSGSFAAKEMDAAYERQSNGDILVKLHTDSKETAKMLPTIANSIGTALMPKDKFHSHPRQAHKAASKTTR